MMRSLWAGVTGLQAHQIAMDVEGHNIANVNTVGFKYEKVSFADQMSQTSRAPTGPEGSRGGTNATQVGLGTSAQSTTKVFKAGSIETTDVTTEVAINGDGFFITSLDGGKTYAYTRNGEFTFDADGNYVNNTGYVVQGWTKDSESNEVDITAPIKSIVIKPSQTIEAEATDTVTVKANLDSGTNVGNSKSPISSLDSFHNAYDADNSGTVIAVPGTPPTYEPGEEHSEDSTTDYKFDTDGNIIERGVDAGVLFDSNGDAVSLREDQGIWVSYRDAVSTSTITAGPGANTTYTFTLNNQDISVDVAGGTSAADTAEEIASAINGYSSTIGVVATTNGAQLTLTNNNNTGTNANSKNIIFTTVGTTPAGFNTANYVTSRYYQYTDDIANPNPGVATDNARTFRTTEDLRYAMQLDATYIGNNLTPAPTNPLDVEVTVNSTGQFQIKKIGGDPSLDIAITGYSDSGISQNSSFASIMQAMNGVISEDDASRTTQNLYTASHTTRTEVYDSLGSKHSLTLEYTKVRSSDSGTQWAVKVSVAEPGEISTQEPRNIVTGYVNFDDSGALSTYSPYNLTFSPNNGAAANQNITLNLGTVGGHDGLTSYDDDSSTGDIGANGYAGGDLRSTRIDSTGNIIGTFTNGKSITLAKIAIAKFANNEGLESEGGNMYTRTPNSGEPIIGTAGTSGRGTLSASSLEMSNVDLSRSLTQLIIVQRGFQANSKTITTSDQMLNTLIQLKQ